MEFKHTLALQHFKTLHIEVHTSENKNAFAQSKVVMQSENEQNGHMIDHMIRTQISHDHDTQHNTRANQEVSLCMTMSHDESHDHIT